MSVAPINGTLGAVVPTGGADHVTVHFRFTLNPADPNVNSPITVSADAGMYASNVNPAA